MFVFLCVFRGDREQQDRKREGMERGKRGRECKEGTPFSALMEYVLPKDGCP